MKLLDSAKRDIKLSLKTIRFEFPRFLCFFVVLFLLQGLFCSILTLYFNNDRTQLDYMESEYRAPNGELYHLKLLGCTETQRAILHNFDMDQEEEKKIFTLLGADITQTADGSRRQFDLYIRFEGDVEESYQTFRARYSYALSEQGPYIEGTTLLLSYELEQVANRAVLILQLTLVVVLGALAVWVLHSIMTNHYKFTYGVYMSFGANFLRLFRTSVWEMVWAALFTWLPAVSVSNLICWLLFRNSGLGFAVSIGGCLLTLLISLLTVCISVFASIRSVSRKPPVKHLIADDNSNLIRSPRHSASLAGSTFPGGVGRLSFLRFRKYVLRLLGTALSFAMLFVGLITLSTCYQRMLDAPRPLYQVDFAVPTYTPPSTDEESDSEAGENTEAEGTDAETDTETSSDAETPDGSDATSDPGSDTEEETVFIDYASYGYTNEISKVFAEMPHLGTVLKESVHPARALHSHIRFDEAAAKIGAGGVSLSRDGVDWRYQMNVDYQSLDSEIIRSFEFLGYGIEGSLESVLTEPGTVAVTDSFMGSVQFDWEIGDVIYVAKVAEPLSAAHTVEQSMMYVTDEDQILLAYLKQCNYEYTAYTIGAIISDMPTEDSWSVFFNAEEYEAVTGYEPVYESVKIYAKAEITEEEEAQMYEWLRKAELVYDNLSVTDLHTRLSKQIDENKNYSGVFTLFAVVLLLICAIVWLISQILFYIKRRGEFELYLAIGAPLSSIRKLFLQDALLYAGFGAGVFALLAPPVSWLIHRAIGYVTILIGGDMLASFQLPIVPYLIGIAMCALCGFVSTMLPYLTYKKQGSPLHRGPGETSRQEETVNE
ncbi:MAG: ABC transporter permease [Clostridia bacterium]|nr:ABC transporter permease [Clostridia bacterium]